MIPYSQQARSCQSYDPSARAGVELLISARALRLAPTAMNGCIPFVSPSVSWERALFCCFAHCACVGSASITRASRVSCVPSPHSRVSTARLPSSLARPTVSRNMPPRMTTGGGSDGGSGRLGRRAPIEFRGCFSSDACVRWATEARRAQERQRGGCTPLLRPLRYARGEPLQPAHGPGKCNALRHRDSRLRECSGGGGRETSGWELSGGQHGRCGTRGGGSSGGCCGSPADGTEGRANAVEDGVAVFHRRGGRGGRVPPYWGGKSGRSQ